MLANVRSQSAAAILCGYCLSRRYLDLCLVTGHDCANCLVKRETICRFHKWVPRLAAAGLACFVSINVLIAFPLLDMQCHLVVS